MAADRVLDRSDRGQQRPEALQLAFEHHDGGLDGLRLHVAGQVGTHQPQSPLVAVYPGRHVPPGEAGQHEGVTS